MTTVMRVPLGSVSLLLMSLILISCSKSDVPPGPEPTRVGGMTECTVKAVQPFITAYVEMTDPNNQMPIRDLQCDSGWAVATGILGPKEAPSNGPQGAPTSIILEAEGQFWIVKEKAKVCGTYHPNNPDAVPADAVVPAALYQSACLAG